MASTGHSPTQTPQSTHESATILALLLSILIASLGHDSRQASQPVHFPLSTFAGITQPFLITTDFEKNDIIQTSMLFTTVFCEIYQTNPRTRHTRHSINTVMHSSAIFATGILCRIAYQDFKISSITPFGSSDFFGVWLGSAVTAFSGWFVSAGLLASGITAGTGC